MIEILVDLGVNTLEQTARRLRSSSELDKDVKEALCWEIINNYRRVQPGCLRFALTTLVELRGELNGISLPGADLSGIDLAGVKLRNVDLRDAKLDGADFHGATFQDVQTQGATFADANVRDADLRGVVADSWEQQFQATSRASGATRWPAARPNKPR